MTLVLASASPTRADMLRSAGVDFDTIPARVDEEEVKVALRAEGVTPRDQADALAEVKALNISRAQPGRLVLGADQILGFEDRGFDKPSTRAEAAEQLRSLRGKRHELFSGAVIALDGAPIWRAIGHARLTMRPFSDEFLDDYLTAIGDEAFETVGAYKVEARGAQLFSRIEGDHFAILGLPLIAILDFLRVRGLLIE